MVVRLHHYNQKEVDFLQKYWIFVYPREERVVFGIHGPAMERVFREYHHNSSHYLNLVIERKDKGRFHITPPVGPASELYNGLTYDLRTCELYMPFMSGGDKVNKEAQREWLAALKQLEPRIISMIRLAGKEAIGNLLGIHIEEAYSLSTTLALIDALKSGTPTTYLISMVQFMIRWQTISQTQIPLEVEDIRKAFAWLVTTHKHEIRKAFGVWGTQ